MSFLYFDEAEVTVTTFYKFSASDGGVLLIGSLDNTVVDRLNEVCSQVGVSGNDWPPQLSDTTFKLY
jgi:hypothetical protein